MDDPQTDAQQIGEILRAARLAAGLTQREVAERSGLTQKTVSEIENGVSNARLSSLQRLARACGARFIVYLAVEGDGADGPE